MTVVSLVIFREGTWSMRASRRYSLNDDFMEHRRGTASSMLAITAMA
jgi:hypothetical protein